jgi:transcriptional regulator of arginine metabolism
MTTSATPNIKTIRQRAILSLIAGRPVRSQEELAHLLEGQGYEVTQATVSRDIKELGLVKVPLKNGDGAAQQFKYVEPGGGPVYRNRLHRIVAELVVNVRGNGNLIVLRTPPGSAMMVASAVDGAEWPEVMGTIAGDDTVFVAVDRAEQLPMLAQRFEDMRTEGT